jgi:hypothetical protein
MAIIHPSDSQAYRAAVTEAFRAKSDFVVDFRIVLPGGEIKHVHKIGHPVLDNAGAVVEWVGTIMDVSERKHAEDELDRVRRLESEREGIYLAGVIVAGMHTNEIFIENGRFHGHLIADSIASKISG